MEDSTDKRVKIKTHTVGFLVKSLETFSIVEDFGVKGPFPFIPTSS